MAAIATYTRQIVDTIQLKTSWLKAYVIVALGLLIFYGVKILIWFYGDTYPVEIDLREVTDSG